MGEGWQQEGECRGYCSNPGRRLLSWSQVVPVKVVKIGQIPSLF